ncbi:hypothetical protein GOV14_02410, partial [Candidatus Pacearchaeota archaeon]|nr:hypothetical protein [Candidatus Pacearchaeota archaeon]
MVKLTKLFTREHTLFYCSVWAQSDIETYNLKTVLFIREGEADKVSVWYDKNELDSILSRIIDQLNTNEKLVWKIEDTFEKYWKLLKVYLKEGKQIQNIDELKKYYKNLIRWWRAMAIITVAPDADWLDEKIKKRLIKMRDLTQEYTDNADKVFTDFFEKNFSEYKDITYLISPNEIFSIKNRKISKKKLDEIKKRKKGFFLY